MLFSYAGKKDCGIYLGKDLSLFRKVGRNKL